MDNFIIKQAKNVKIAPIIKYLIWILKNVNAQIVKDSFGIIITVLNVFIQTISILMISNASNVKKDKFIILIQKSAKHVLLQYLSLMANFVQVAHKTLNIIKHQNNAILVWLEVFIIRVVINVYVDRKHLIRQINNALLALYHFSLIFIIKHVINVH